ncbi:prepilin-type N-terminal cleavage/methylation domain-containing protein [Planococcus liqunii]|uniref:prepilin-type N-terminal cleavage/methylation domain-containing protein n=1 Tax=Planococcus liqunii TaxID=3058394 RepID=UPI00261F808C|nr:prepilin-type N-terminal cleavage/methylation domain-containing protein [Planococcus sp. N056]WKA52446.1 prepilin-type N-terminal cleavage/methylation domain-containing protein [Planococcus sp. N056]
MKKFLQKKLKEQKGMTLIELLAVIVIIAIIAAIAIPAIGNIIDNSREKAAVSDAQMVLSAGNLFFTENGTPENGTANIAVAADGTKSGTLVPFIDDAGNITTATVKKLTAGNQITATVVTDQGTYQFNNMTNNALANITDAQLTAAFTAKP